MDKLFDFGNRYARESTWKDFALVKFCLFSMGLAAGTQIPEKHKKKAIKTRKYSVLRSGGLEHNDN